MLQFSFYSLAVEERWGKKGYELADREEVWELESYYIAQALVNYTLMLSPRRIILGGGLMHQEQLFPLVRKKLDTKAYEQIKLLLNYI